jgi:hypothetical protein
MLIMKQLLTPDDIKIMTHSVEVVCENQTELIGGLLMPAIESVDISLSHQVEDLAGDTALGFAEVHSKIDFLRSEIAELKHVLNSLFR